MREVLAARASANFVGRERELAVLLECALSAGPVVAWVHGPPGIGKTALLQEFSRRAADQGCVSVSIDCRFVEPTPEAFLSALGDRLERRLETAEMAADALPASQINLLVLDSYELLRLMDGWIRQVFVPALPDNVRVVLSARYGPGPGWLTALEWQGLVRTISLSPLAEAESVGLLERQGLTTHEAETIHRIARGHPMALVLGACSAGNVRSGSSDSGSLVQQLTRLYLSDVPDGHIRTAVEASSVVRRTTRSLLASMLPETYSADLYDRLADLPIVEPTSEGLMLHEQIQDALASWLRSSDPHRFRMYRQAAWRQLRAESSAADYNDRWRYTADMLYLLQNPNIREAFFPSGSQSLSPEPARANDAEAIFSIAEAHETRSAAEAIQQWWHRSPESFQVLRDRGGAIAGFYLVAEWPCDRTSLPEGDIMVSAWRRHLREQPLARDESAIFIRRWLSESAGESPSAVQAACWTDVKRSYLRLRPHIRRCYVSLTDLATYARPTTQVGFQYLPNASVSFDGVTCHLGVLDFGPGSIDGWLSSLVANELGLVPSDFLDTDARELVLEDERVGLTALEYGVLAYLRQREGKAVSRAELLEQVWKQRADCGSNVVDAVVRSLRSKLRERSSLISTIRGVGYCLRSVTAYPTKT